MKITEALFSEHQVFHSMFDSLEALAPNLKTLSEIKAVASLVESMLKGHADPEDDLVLGPLEHCFEQIGQRDSFITEHQEMDANLHQVQLATRLAEAKDLLLAAVAHSRRHFDREERIVFPMAEAVLKSETLMELGRAWMEQRTRTTVEA